MSREPLFSMPPAPRRQKQGAWRGAAWAVVATLIFLVFFAMLLVSLRP